MPHTPNVQLAHGSNDELAMLVRPGTPEAELVSRAVVAGLQEATDSGKPLDPVRTWAVRKQVMSLNGSAYRGETEPIKFEGEAADIALEGLSVLALKAIEERGKFEADKYLSPEQRRALEPGVEIMEMWGGQAQGLQEELLEQGATLGSQRRQARRIPRQRKPDTDIDSQDSARL